MEETEARVSGIGEAADPCRGVELLLDCGLKLEVGETGG
jgi:hypothetical protein